MVLESNTYIDISPFHEILSGMNFILSISVGVSNSQVLQGLVKPGYYNSWKPSCKPRNRKHCCS